MLQNYNPLQKVMLYFFHQNFHFLHIYSLRLIIKRIFAPMKTGFLYSTDFYAVNTKELNGSCLHLICTEGEGSFVFNEKCFHIRRNDLVVVTNPHRISNIAAPESTKVEWFAAGNKFLNGLLPANNYSIGGSISLNNDPVIPLSDENARRFLDDIHRLKERMNDSFLQFYDGLMGSLCLTMIYDIFEFHALYYGSVNHTDRAGYIVRSLMQMLSTDICRTEREVTYYADKLHVSPKYLSETVRRITGTSVTTYIGNATIPILKELLANEQLSLTQIADMMNFNTLSYFCRYCKRQLGKTPSEYRKSLQPKKHT